MKSFNWIYTLLAAVLIPFFIMMGAIRLLMTPIFLRYEYLKPNFPADPYGLTTQDRLQWAPYALDYLLNDADISYLRDLTFPDGRPLFNERELSHMVDVKNVVQLGLRVWAADIALLLILALIAVFSHRMRSYLLGLSIGGWITVGVILLILVAVFTNFDVLFTTFHQLFFTSGSWVFYYSDTLIRLFPLPFWSDGFTFMGILSTVGGLLFGIGARGLSKRFGP